MTPQIAVIGNGYWGKNLVRNFHSLGALRMVCDSRPDALREAQSRFGVSTCEALKDVLSDAEVEGVAIAAPAAQHYKMVKACLSAGKDVYVEKPLALKVEEGREIVRLAEASKCVLMVGHILQYHPALLKLKELICSGELGRIQYIYSSRLNFGKLRTEENILWSFAPHDISAILYLLDEVPTRVTATGGAYVNPQIYDATLSVCEFQSGVKAHVFVSWLHPFKEQRMVVVGDQKTAVFDDLETERKLVLYSHSIDWRERLPVAQKGEGHAVSLSGDEPLRKECEHFLDCVRMRTTPRTDGVNGVRVLEVLDACERSLQSKGVPVQMEQTARQFTADPTAVIDEGSEIGIDTRIWHFSHIMTGARIGSSCNLGQNVVVSPGVRIGDRVKIQNNVSVYAGVELEDDVFCGPSMVFTNVINPRSHVDRKREFRTTLVRRGATIGANATIVCGVVLGRYCLVAAGAVVTRDVADFALMVGVPATRVGWVCACGVRLPDGTNVLCKECGRAYRVDLGRCSEEHPASSMISAENTVRGPSKGTLYISH